MARILALLFTLLALSTAARADPPDRVARLNYATGAVSFAPAQAPESWTQAVLNRPLTSGDRLWSDQSGRAELHVGSTAIRLAALTSLDVLNLDDHALYLRLAQGSINVRVRDLGAHETIEIATSSGTVLLRQPGSYSISSEPQSDLTRVLVHFGEAHIVTPTQSVAVPSSQSAMISSRAGIAFELVTEVSIDEFDRWSAGRDRREDRIASTQYVSREMTGYEDLDSHGTWRTLPQYGAVWVPTRVAPDWAPYRYGHWAWIAPWGWTWIDDAPWGFAPFHYGRWVWVNNYWAWAPGRFERRPAYAPALVAFIGGSNFQVAIGSGPAVGWFPLSWREPYRPWYRASPAHVHRVNIIHNTTVSSYAHRGRREAITVVPQLAFVSARPVARSNMSVPPAALARAEILRDRSPAEPEHRHFVEPRAGQRPPASPAAREVMTVTTPTTPVARDAGAARERARPSGVSLPSSVASPAVAPAPATSPAASAVAPPAARSTAAPRVLEAPAMRGGAFPPAGADSERRNARREAGPRDDARDEASGGRRERERPPAAAIAREAPQQMQSPVAGPRARIEREAPIARMAPAAEAPSSPAQAAQVLQAPPQSQRREERGREGGGGSRPGREGGSPRGQRDG